MQPLQPKAFVAYYRVSTQKQGQSGLGLEAQRSACQTYQPIAEFVEVESGKKDDREELAKAVAFARANNAWLVFAKLDRLSRDVEFIVGFMKRGVTFRCADIPNADEFMLHMYAVLAHKERRFISERTRDALAKAKQRGVKLGGVQPGLREKINAFDAHILKEIQSIKDSGIVSASGIAKQLNARSVRTSKGNQWQAVQVQRIMSRSPK